MKKRLISMLMVAALATSAASALAVDTKTDAKTDVKTDTTADVKTDAKTDVKTDATTTTPTAPATETTTVVLPADVAADAWYAEAAKYVLSGKLMETIDGKFAAATVMTREQIAAVIGKDAAARGLTVEGGMALKEAPDFATISADALAGVEFCYYADIMKGDDKGNINPTGKVTRAELAKMLSSYAKKAGMTAGTATDIKTYTDYSAIAAWATESVQFCADTGMLKGNAAGSFTPAGNVTRAEFAQIMMNINSQLTAAKTDAPAAKPDASTDTKTDAKTDTKTDAKTDAKTDTKTDAKTDTKTDATV